MRQLLLAASLTAVAHAQLGLTVNADATYAVSLDKKTWLASAADAYVISYNGQPHSFKDGSLKADGAPTPISGNDILGSYSGYSVGFNAGIFVASFRLYEERSTLIFQQSFPKGLVNMNITMNYNDLATGFPAFGPSQSELNSTDVGFLSWSGGMCPGHTGVWNAAGSKSADLGSQSGPLVLFDNAGNALAMSPASGFMTAQIAFGNACGSALCAGHNGLVTNVPAGWTLETALVGGAGINNTVMALGDVLLARGGKTRTAANADLTVSTLGWWSDNGTVQSSSCWWSSNSPSCTPPSPPPLPRCRRLLLLQRRAEEEHAGDGD